MLIPGKRENVDHELAWIGVVVGHEGEPMYVAAEEGQVLLPKCVLTPKRTTRERVSESGTAAEGKSGNTG